MTSNHHFTPASQEILSPLRYPGSKRRLAGYLKNTLKINSIKPSLYIEPFLGGASVALQLMQEDLVDQVILIDVDPWVASFWRTVFFDTDWLLEQVENIEITLDHWKKFKANKPKTIRDEALTCLFLNRTSFSGILRDEVGPLGGKMQASQYKIDCRFTRPTLTSRILQAAVLRDHVHAVWNCSWDDGIEKIRQDQRRGSLPSKNLFFYFDPPFFKEAESLYRFFFKQEDHIRLRDFLLKLEDRWILSYDFAEEVETLYGSAIKKGTNGTHRQPVELLYSLAIISEKRSKGKEVIISNLEKLPDQSSGIG